jgi:hypothetical protein
MSTFTIPLKKVIDIGGNIGLSEYPLFDEEYRDTLNKKIIAHYWNREIGQETISMFTFAMVRKMNEIMPYYNQLYQTLALTIDPFITFRQTTTSETSGDSTSKANDTSAAMNVATTDSKARAVGSDTPQTQLSGDEDYATSIQDSTSRSDTDGNSETTSVSEQNASQTGMMTSTAEGFSGSRSALLMAYRETFLNVDMSVIEELDELFMQVWSTGEEMFGHHWGFPSYIYGGMFS